MRSKRKDPLRHIGYRKNNQEIIEFIDYRIRGKKAEAPYYKVLCHNCNKYHFGFYYNIADARTSGIVCQQCNNITTKIYTLLSATDSQISINYSNYKAKCKIKKWNFELSKEEFKNLVLNNCHYCNQEPNQFRMDRAKNKRTIDTAFLMNGIDRLDSNIGYNINNVVSCCEDCNKAKRNLSYEQFLELIKRIYNFKIKDYEFEEKCEKYKEHIMNLE